MPSDDTITAIAPAYGFGSQTAFPSWSAHGQLEAGKARGGAELFRKAGHEYPAYDDTICRVAAVGRQGVAGYRQLGALTVFLASDAAASITGAALLVDGGWTAH